MSEILLSQLAHVELISPKPAETVRWFTDVFGLEQTSQEGQSAYLRGWAEWFHSSLVVTEGREPGVGHIAWRTYGPEDPDTIARRLGDTEEAIGWVDSSVGHGPAFRYHSPFGRQVHEVFWEVERYQAPPEKLDPNIPSRPQRYPGRGINARYLDHVTLPTRNMAGDIEFFRRLGARHTAQTEAEPGFPVFATLTCNGIRSTHDLAIVPEFAGLSGRLHHVAFRVDQRIDVERAAEVFLAHDTAIEYGPGIHGIDEITYLYLREPGGIRMEINSGGWTNAQPDWEPSRWTTKQSGNNIYRNVVTPDSFMESFPAVGTVEAGETEVGFRSSGLYDVPTG